MAIVASIRIILMSVPGSMITHRTQHHHLLNPFKPGLMPFAILISACKLIPLVVRFDAAQKYSTTRNKLADHPDHAERETH
jgi:hypothetical protein